MSPRQYLDRLVQQQLFPDAVKFVAHALPKSEAIRWSCQCARQAYGPNPAPPAAAALQAVEQWLADPSEANRRAAWSAAQAADVGTPAGCTALAVFWSGGSMAPPEAPVVPPAEHLTAHAVGGAVMLAVVHTEPQRAAEKYRQFLSLGLEAANGGRRK
jgi:hypothetical protein